MDLNFSYYCPARERPTGLAAQHGATPRPSVSLKASLFCITATSSDKQAEMGTAFNVQTEKKTHKQGDN